MSDKKLRLETLLLHAGYDPQEHQRASTVPIYQTAAYEYSSAQQAAKLFALEEFGAMYSRLTNPTVEVLEKRLAAIHGGTLATAVASGHAAQFLTINALCSHGDNIIASTHLYGGTYNQFKNSFPRLGITTRFFDPSEPQKIAELADAKTKAVYLESLGNPNISIPDIKKIAQIAHKIGVPLIIDNTSASAALLRPIEHGADVVVESLTKFVGGHGNSLGGVVIDAGTFPWLKHVERFPTLAKSEPSYHGLIFAKKFPQFPLALRVKVDGLRDYGSCLSPFNAFLILQGLETLTLRMERHSENAQTLATYLAKHKKIASVNYPGLKTSKYHSLAKKYFPKGLGGLLSFELKSGLKAGKKLLESVKVAQHQTNLGDNKTIVTHPASTTHAQLTTAEQKAGSITPGLVRVSVGIENIEDIIADFEQALSMTN